MVESTISKQQQALATKPAQSGKQQQLQEGAEVPTVARATTAEVVHEPVVDKVVVEPTRTEHVHEEISRVHLQPVIERQDVIQRQELEAPTVRAEQTLPTEVREVGAETEAANVAEARERAMASVREQAAMAETRPELRSTAFEGSAETDAAAAELVERHIQPHVVKQIHQHTDVDVRQPVTEIVHEQPIVRDLGVVELPVQQGTSDMPPPVATTTAAPAASAASAQKPDVALFELLAGAPAMLRAKAGSDISFSMPWHARSLDVQIRATRGLVGSLKSAIGAGSSSDVHYVARISEEGTSRSWSSSSCSSSREALREAAAKAAFDLE